MSGELVITYEPKVGSIDYHNVLLTMKLKKKFLWIRILVCEESDLKKYYIIH